MRMGTISRSAGLVAIVCGTMMIEGVCEAQTIVSGPVFNPTTRNRYTLIQATSWEQARIWARARGGDLATINDAGENAWVFNTFSPGGVKYMIGLAAVDVPGTLTWSDGSTSAYRNWAVNEPKITSGSKYVTVQSDEKWYVRNTNYAPFYIVEMSGPLKVPEQYPTLDVAIQAANAMGFYEVQIGPGTHVLSSTFSLGQNAARGLLRGAGTEQSLIVCGSSMSTSPSLSVSGNIAIQDVSFLRSTDNPIIGAGAGVLRLERVVLDGANVRGSEPLVLVNSMVLATRTTFKNAFVGFENSYSGQPSVAANNCVFDGIAGVTTYGLAATFSNCTFSNVGLNGTNVFGGTALLTNCILWSPRGPIGGGMSAVASNIAGAVYPGEGNISVDPRFVAGTLNLAADSPCIDAGNGLLMLGGSVDAAGLARVSGAAVDMGAYEVQQTPPPVCGADFDGDGFITFEDFDAFVAAFEAGC